MLLASVRQLASQAGPTTAAAAQADIERRLVGSPVDIAGGAGTASLTNLTLQPDLPPDQTAGQAWTFATLDPRLPAADDVQFTVALTLNWRVHEPVTWHLERINEPAGLCQEILAREVGLILRAFRHDEAADAQETARKQLVGAPLDVGHGLQTVLRSIRVTLGPSSRPVDLSSHSAEFDATLPTRDPAIPLDAKVDISWRVRDQVRWTRQPIEDLPLRCQAEATRRLRAVTTHYIWQDMAAAQQHIDEHVCPTDIDVDGSVELRIVSVRLTPPAGLMKSGQELENATVGVKITEERLKGQAARREWELKHAFELQKAFDDGVHPIVLKAIVDPPNAAKAFTELSAQQQAEQRMQFEFAAELAKAGQVSTELARKILAAQSALGIPADSEPLPVGRRGRPRPLPVPKDQDAVPEIAARATEGDTEKIADEVTDEEIPEGTDNQQAASGSGS